MTNYTKYFFLLIIIPMIITSCQQEVREIERPEKIVSKRQIVYDDSAYDKLANLWKDYYEEFPSEDAYSNWMYAARYAKWPDYKYLLEEGIELYPANPTLLYLKALVKNGSMDNLESIHLLERAVALDPAFKDPWFGLAADYLSIGNLKKSEEALRKLLEENAISDEVMDYNYNVISLLDLNAILITNGDNDTYPAWIITKILNYRPDVKIVNRSLLNTEWYPLHIIENEGIPNFINESSLTKLRNEIWKEIEDGNIKMPSAGPFSDSLITKLISEAEKDEIPIYLAATLFRTGVINKFLEHGENFGLVTRINRDQKRYSERIQEQVEIWLKKFRTGGLESWKLKYGKETASGKWLAVNYGESMKILIDPVSEYSQEKLLPLFNWYKNYILDLLPKEKAEAINSAWCDINDIEEIRDWCQKR